MPRCKRPHRHEVLYLPLDEGVPLARQRAIYTRLSDSDADSVSHAQQEDAARRYAAFRGYVVTATYRDWRTGTDTDRLALKQLVEDAHANMHGGVVFYDHTRLYRGLVGSYPIVRLHSELPSYEFEATAEGFEIEQLATWAFISGNELATTRRRSMDQRRQRAAVGQWMAGNKPYWLKRDPQTREAVIIVERAAAVLQAIAQYANGGPMTMVARWMSEHAPANGRHSRWSSTRLRQLFRNPALWGELAYGRSLVLTEVRDGEVVVVGRTVNPDAVPFHVPPLIHYTELERSQCQLAAGCERDSYPAGATLDALIKGNNPRAGARAYQLEHPLRRRVVCPCGWRMGFRQKRYKGVDKDYGYLICTRTQQRGKSVVADYPDCSVSGVSTLELWPRVREMFLDAVAILIG